MSFDKRTLSICESTKKKIERNRKKWPFRKSNRVTAFCLNINHINLQAEIKVARKKKTGMCLEWPDAFVSRTKKITRNFNHRRFPSTISRSVVKSETSDLTFEIISTYYHREHFFSADYYNLCWVTFEPFFCVSIFINTFCKCRFALNSDKLNKETQPFELNHYHRFWYWKNVHFYTITGFIIK